MSRHSTRYADGPWLGVIGCDRDRCHERAEQALTRDYPDRPPLGAPAAEHDAYRAAQAAYLAELDALPLPTGWVSVDGLAERPMLFCSPRCARLWLQGQEK